MLFHNQIGIAPMSRNYTGGAEDQYEDQSEDMKRGVVRRPRPLRPTFRLLVIIIQPLQKCCPQDLSGNIRPGIWSCESFSMDRAAALGNPAYFSLEDHRNLYHAYFAEPEVEQGSIIYKAIEYLRSPMFSPLIHAPGNAAPGRASVRLSPFLTL